MSITRAANMGNEPVGPAHGLPVSDTIGGIVVEPTPIQQPPLEDIKNAIQIVGLWACEANCPMDAREAFASADRLLRHAIDGLSEPSLAAMQAGEILLKEWSGTPEPQRQLRDTLAGIIAAQISGVVPETWVKTWGKS